MLKKFENLRYHFPWLLKFALRAASIWNNLNFLLFMLPCGRPRFWKWFSIIMLFSKSQNTIICLGSSIRNMLEVLILKNVAKCNSQHLKRTSGAWDLKFLVEKLEISLTDLIWRMHWHTSRLKSLSRVGSVILPKPFWGVHQGSSRSCPSLNIEVRLANESSFRIAKTFQTYPRGFTRRCVNELDSKTTTRKSKH